MRKRSKQRMVKKPNPIAKSLSNRLFQFKVLHSKKLYNRLKEKLYTLKAAATKDD